MDNLSTEELVKRRKDALKSIIGKNKFSHIFSILTLVSLLIGLLPKVANGIVSFLFGLIGQGFPILIKETTLFGLSVDSGYLFLAIAFAISTFLASKEKFNLSFYPILAWLVWLSVYLRSINIPGLRDISTGEITLGPDLDPWLFTRWAKEIVETGTLAAVDTLRYVPIGFETKSEYLLHPYMIAWFHNLASLFGSTSVTHSAVLYPVFFFAITVVAFFILTRKIFLNSKGKTKANIIATISSFFLITLSPLLPRTIAGIPEKESAAFFFFFLALYFFLSAWDSKDKKKGILLAILAGASTASMALIWGGYIYLMAIIGISSLIAFLLGKIKDKEVLLYGLWIVSSFSLMIPFSIEFTFKGLLRGTVTGATFFILIIFILDRIIYSTKLKNFIEKESLRHFPRQIKSLILSGILGLIAATIFIDTQFIANTTNYIISNLIQPAQSRLIQTVAENRQPFFTEWVSSFGPALFNLPIVFWFFFIGSIFLFSHTIRKTLDKKARIILTIAFTFLISAISFSRYSGSSTFNGTNMASTTFYALGLLAFFITAGYYYYKDRMSNENSLKNVEYSLILTITLFILILITARGAVRLIMMLVIPASILTAYLLVRAYEGMKKGESKKKVSTIIFIIVLILALIAGAFHFNATKQTAANYVPSVYNQQWQLAMSWVRDNTSQDAVFGHWWDYGYWLQGIGERATVLDGGNAVSYWNHLMGRYALTGTDNRAALDFLYAHETTHLLIDSTDIGKYGAFSSIGSDPSYDRASYIPVIDKDLTQAAETKNGIRFIYRAGVGLDEDVIYELDGEKIFLPAGRAALGGVSLELNSAGEVIGQPIAIFLDQGRQIEIPMKYAFDTELREYDEGLEAGIRIIPRFIEDSQGQRIDHSGSLLYLSKRTVNAQLTRLYLYGEEGNGFNLAHSEDDIIVKDLKRQGASTSEFINYRGFRGPIKIWEINYPSDIQVNEEFLETTYPEGIYAATR